MTPAVVSALLAVGVFSPRSGEGEPPRREQAAQGSMTDSQRNERLRERDRTAWEARRLADEVQSEEAIGMARRMLAIQRELFGDSHPDVAGALDLLANIAQRFARFEEAGAAFKEALAIRTKAGGPDHWLTVDARYAWERNDRLVGLDEARREKYRAGRRTFRQAGELGKGYERAKSLRLYREGLVLLKEALGVAHPEYAHWLDQLARQTLLGAGGFSEQTPGRKEADAFAAQAQAIRNQVLGERHPDYALSLESRFRYLPTDHDPARTKGEPLLRRALEIRKATQGEHHPDYALALVNLAQVLEQKPQGDLVEAEGLYRTALEIEREVYGPDSIRLTNTLTYLSRIYQNKLGNLDLAEPWLLEQVRIRRKDVAAIKWIDDGRWSVPLGQPPETEGTRSSLLWVLFVRREVLGSSLGALARLYGEKGELGRASRSLEEALDVFEEGFQYRAAAVGASDYRANFLSIYLQNLWTYLTLSLDPRAEIEPGTAYRRVMAWKGAHFLAERRARKWRDRPEMRPLYAELRAASADVSRLSLPPPAQTDSAAWERLYAAMRRKEDLEVELAARVQQIGRDEGRVALGTEAIRAALPYDVVLVDFLVVHTGLRWKGGRNDGLHLLAFVVGKDRVIRRLDLGPVEPIEAMVEAWRVQAEHLGDTGRVAEALAQRIWRPLEPYITGARTVLVSPDGPLTRFPLAALPGKAPGTFLVEDLAIVVVPVPQLLAAESPPPSSTSQLLLVGDVDFGADPGSASSSTDPADRGAVAPRIARAGRAAFPPLPGTRREIESIRDRFVATHPGERWLLLRGAEATERAFRAALPGSRYVHLATHGFFSEVPASSADLPASAYWRSPQALAGHSPGLFSGITLAGVNRPPRAGREDGIITALEAQQLDLGGVELVVLSACETSLGSQTKGEGMMGLQRAFQVAGARSLISTLWTVDDSATSTLMEEFYNNLWVRRLTKREAIRQAQVALLRRYDPVRKRLRRGSEVDRPDRPTNEPATTARPNPEPATPPDFWAAFTLSGDWR